MYEAQSPLGIFNALANAREANHQAVKQASARGHLPAQVPEQTKQASAQPQGAALTEDAQRREALLKCASLNDTAADLITVQIQKQASGTGPAAVQPASSLGPADNENMVVPRGQYNPSEARKYKTGTHGFEDDGFGSNHIETNETNKPDLGYTASSDGLGKKAPGPTAKQAAAWLKSLAKQAERGNPESHQVGNSGTASGQPASTLGARDDEAAKLPNTEAHSRATHNRSSWDVGHTNAQDAEARAKSHEFPLTEPQSHDINSQSGWGSGPTTSAGKGPEPNKTASVAALRQQLINTAHLFKVAASKCAKCGEMDKACECGPKDKGKTKSDKDKGKGKEKQSQMDMGMDPSMGAADAGVM